MSLFGIEMLKYGGIVFLDNTTASESMSAAFHDPALLDHLGHLEMWNIWARTPVLTGMLLASETYRIQTARHDPLLIEFFSDVAGFDRRYYAPYQEGPSLGLSTYTNPPRQMFYAAETEDVGVFESWGEEVAAFYTAKLGTGPSVIETLL